MKFIRKIFSLISIRKSASTVSNKKDDLIGLWENDLDDGSGLHAFWGWSFRFNEDGSGTYFYWEDQELQSETPFSWFRTSPNSIKIKYNFDENWTIIEYSTKIIDAPYSGKLKKLTDNNFVQNDFSHEGFWHCPGAIFKML